MTREQASYGNAWRELINSKFHNLKLSEHIKYRHFRRIELFSTCNLCWLIWLQSHDFLCFYISYQIVIVTLFSSVHLSHPPPPVCNYDIREKKLNAVNFDSFSYSNNHLRVSFKILCPLFSNFIFCWDFTRVWRSQLLLPSLIMCAWVPF